MASIGRFFEGNEIIFPGVYINRIYEAGLQSLGNLGSVLFLIGESDIGIPYNAKDYDGTTELSPKEKIIQITKTSQVKDKLGSGVLFDATRFCLKPAKDETITAPSIINCISVNQKTRATNVSQNSATTDVLKIHTVNFGSDMNKFSKKISNGSTTGKKFELQYLGEIYTKDNIEYQTLTIDYIGAGTVVTMDIDATGLSTTVDAVPDLNILFANYETVGQLIAYINTLSDYTAVLSGDTSFKTENLDHVTGVNINDTAPYAVMADLWAIINHINTTFSNWLYAEHVTGNARLIPDNDTDFVVFSGGSTSSATNTDWSNVAKMLESLNADYISILSSDDTVRGYFEQHADDMNSISGQNERMIGAGSSTIMAKADIIEDCKTTNRSTFCYAANRLKMRDESNVLKTWDGFYTMAMIFAIKAANGIMFPLTLKSLNCEGINDTWDSEDNKDLMQARAIVVREPTDGEFEIQRALTTYQGDDLILQSLEGVALTLHISKFTRGYVQGRIKSMQELLRQAQINILQDNIENELLPAFETMGWLTEDVQNDRPAFDNVTFNVLADTFEYEFDGIIPLPLNYVLGTHRFSVVGNLSLV